LAPSNQENPIFNDLLKNLNNIKASGKNEILTPAEITLKEEASIEYSSGEICEFILKVKYVHEYELADLQSIKGI
jgi:hypothetical protein